MTTHRKASASESQARWVDPVKQALDEAEDLLREAAATGGQRAEELQAKALETLRRSRVVLHEVQDSLLDRGRQAAQTTDEFVHERPWQAVTIAGAAGLLLGLLLARR